MYQPFYKRLQEASKKLAPGLAGQAEVSWDHLISPIEIRLPPAVLKTAREAVAAFFRVSRLPEYPKRLGPVPAVCARPPANSSVLMAYDFHTTEDGECFLVEINTNASGFMLASLMNMAHTGEDPESFGPLKDLFFSFENELRLFGGSIPSAPKIAIVDENLLEQKMYPEFLIYRDWFNRHGWPAELVDAAEFKAADFVYNRTTDFYFDQENLHGLRRAYEHREACFSPHPYEYWRLADKERLIQFGTDSLWEGLGASEADRAAISKVLIPSYDSKTFASPDEVWEQRKTLFFKPKRSHGGKSVYRGESVSKKVFERLMMEDVLIQKFQPAQRVPVEDARSVLNNWKFDLRFFAYEDKIQLWAARIYQGQVTNFASPLGGFTFVQF